MTDEYIKKSYVANLIKDFCKDLIERKRSRVEITEFNADIQVKLDRAPGIVSLGGWISTECEVPADDSEVLATADGNWKNVRFEHAVLLAYYVDGEWILEQYPEATDITVSHWASIPELPGEAEE